MADRRPRVKAPKTASKGEVFTVKTLISHPMETGLRKDKKGNKKPINIIEKFTCTYNGDLVFAADLEPAIAANPFLSFTVRAEESGTLEFAWYDDDGSVYKKTHQLTVQ
jgi:sulfur-oxidizing protein SoxZ